ncbi:hypothetical protein XPA_005820 [Xanthoria parietina]
MYLKQCYHDANRADHASQWKRRWRSECVIFTLKGAAPPPGAIHSFNVRSFCCQPTTFYWTANAQRSGRCPSFIFGAVYKTWSRCHNNITPLDHEHFFANLVQITETGPKSIHEIVEAHRLLADQVASFLTRLRQESKIDPPRFSLPDYHLLQLSRAIIVVYDEFLTPDFVREPRFRIFLDKEARRQQVLLVLTGDDHELSAPISFDSIRSESLPITQNTSSAAEKPYDMIRVPLIVAIQFILDLQQREKAAIGPASMANDDASADTSDRDAAEYADGVLRSFAHDTDREQKSRFTMSTMQCAVEKIEERERGEEPLPVLDVDMLDVNWE